MSSLRSSSSALTFLWWSIGKRLLIKVCNSVKVVASSSTANRSNNCCTASLTQDTSSNTSSSHIDSPLISLSTMAEHNCPTDDCVKHFSVDNPWPSRISVAEKHLLSCDMNNYGYIAINFWKSLVYYTFSYCDFQVACLNQNTHVNKITNQSCHINAAAISLANSITWVFIFADNQPEKDSITH